ncbi:hypothetical protein K7X08_021321 [Anisodus acutangulus]|uniref:Uncharacterized protein n=1 Tax=Anisodus acutangulus TaxID=402998 RepID=A0A9Q1M0Z8_9SOLA|nr:hypothetical protein K7X08_021321 [Anisodus acutangulus]
MLPSPAPDNQLEEEGSSANSQHQQQEESTQHSPKDIEQGNTNTKENNNTHSKDHQNMQLHLYHPDEGFVSIPSEIKALQGIQLTVDLDNDIVDSIHGEEANKSQQENGKTKKQQQTKDKQIKHSHHQIKVDSPNKVIVIIPEDQLQSEPS